MSGGEKPDGNRWMVMPEDISRRCEQLGYDFGFARNRFANKGRYNGNAGWCGWNNARTAYFNEWTNSWRPTSDLGLGSCAHGAVKQARCCHAN